MKAGANWPATTVKTGGQSAMVAGGCGNPDRLSSPAWTSATPAFSPTVVPPRAHDPEAQWGDVNA